jgi:hypothetical protein
MRSSVATVVDIGRLNLNCMHASLATLSTHFWLLNVGGSLPRFLGGVAGASRLLLFMRRLRVFDILLAGWLTLMVRDPDKFSRIRLTSSSPMAVPHHYLFEIRVELGIRVRGRRHTRFCITNEADVCSTSLPGVQRPSYSRHDY